MILSFLLFTHVLITKIVLEEFSKTQKNFQKQVKKVRFFDRLPLKIISFVTSLGFYDIMFRETFKLDS